MTDGKKMPKTPMLDKLEVAPFGPDLVLLGQ